jgi:predicted AAA+ superfamily ATPase
MNEKFEHLMLRAEQLIARIEAVLPQPLAAPPDWDASIAWRYRKRGGPWRAGAGAPCGLDEARRPQGDRAAEEKIQRNTEQFVRGRRPTTCC